MQQDAALSIVVVDDHRTFADLLMMALNAQPDLTCVGSAASAAEAVELVHRTRPDVVVMDLQLGGDDGIDATRQLLEIAPLTRVVVLTAHTRPQHLVRAAAAGACAFLSKTGALDEMLETLRNVRAGRMVVDPGLVTLLPRDGDAAGADRRGERGVPRPRSERPAVPQTELTARELEVLRLLGEGRDLRSIAELLGVSLHTCRGHVKNVLVKLGAHSQLEAVVIATRSGLLRLG